MAPYKNDARIDRTLGACPATESQQGRDVRGSALAQGGAAFVAVSAHRVDEDEVSGLRRGFGCKGLLEKEAHIWARL